MERLVLFVCTAGVLSAVTADVPIGVRGQAALRSPLLRSANRALDPLVYDSSAKESSRNRRARHAAPGEWRDLFGHFKDDYGSPYKREARLPYPGEIAPFWSFRTNTDFVFNNDRPRYRSKPLYSEEDSMEAAGTDIIEDEADPEPPKREEEFISEHEEPRDVPTRPKYGVPGGWAKGEVPGKEQVDVGFVPIQIYSQTRRYDSEEHLPREKAVEEAQNQEELLAAPRLREVLRNKKLHEVYEEEGYEDLGYDHGGYNHHGVKVEGATKNEHGAYRKLPPSAQDLDPKGSIMIKVFNPAEGTGEVVTESDETTGQRGRRIDSNAESTAFIETSTPKDIDIKGLRAEATVASPRNSVMLNVKQNLTIFVPDSSNMADRMDVSDDRADRETEARVRGTKITFPGKSARRQYMVSPIVVSPDVEPREESVQNPQVVHQVASYLPSPFNASPSQFTSTSPALLASTINTYASLINQNFSAPILREPLIFDIEQSRFNSSEDYSWNKSSLEDKNSKIDQSDTFRSGSRDDKTNSKISNDKKTDLQKYDESSEGHKYSQGQRHTGRRRNTARRGGTSLQNKNANGESEGENVTAATMDSYTITANKESSLVSKRDKVYSNFTRGNVKYNPEDDSQWTPTVGTLNIRHPSLPFDPSGGKSEGQTKDEVSFRIQYPEPIQSSQPLTINVPDGMEPSAKKDQSANAKYVEQLTLAHFSAPVNISPHQGHSMSQDERLKELAKQLNAPQEETQDSRQRRKRSIITYSKDKYPHYESPPSISKNSAMRYATNKANVPKKSYGGMEFYESKEKLNCKGPSPPRKVSPQKDREGDWEEDPMPDGPRVKGVGEAIDCFKQKYFGEDPLDNPLFKEEDIEIRDDSEDVSAVYEKPQLEKNSKETENRKVMTIENKSIERPKTPKLRSRDESVTSSFEESTASPEDVAITTTAQPRYSGHQYYVYESLEEPAAAKTPSPSTKQNHYNSLQPDKSKYLLKKKKHNLIYFKQPISVYSIISTNDIPIHHAPFLIPEHGKNLVPTATVTDPGGPYLSKSYPPKVYPYPNQFAEEKIIVTKREADDAGNDFWSLINPMKWWLPNLFDSRRNEPRYRRSADEEAYDVISSEEISELMGQRSEIVEVPAEIKKPLSTNPPITLAEFKTKFNIPEPTKKITSRLTGGFINRNLEISDAMEMLLNEPTEPSTRSTVPTTTVKPKVIFPRAKLPRRKTYSPKTAANFSVDITTEATTTTTTSTLPPTTTTRMYKPKRVLNKNYGKGSFDAFTILKNQRDITTQLSFESTEVPEISNRNDEPESENVKKIQLAEQRRVTKEDTTTKATNVPERPVTDTIGITKVNNLSENETLTYMVNPVTGVGSWGEQRKWKPKRKRPNTPSIYSYVHAKKKEGASRKKQRAIPESSEQGYLSGLIRSLQPSGSSIEETLSEYYGKEKNSQSGESINLEKSFLPKPTIRPYKPPPKYILEPNKRRYYYAKVR